MEQIAKEFDLRTCPLCGSREFLVIRWIQDLDRRVHKETVVGCKKCDKYFSEKEDRHAVAAWNHFAIQQSDGSLRYERHLELYRLLYAHSQAEKQVAALWANINEYLEKNITLICPLKEGDMFKIKGMPGETWSVKKVRSVYSWNIGPFWIIDSVNVQKNGRLGDKQHEICERDKAKLIPIKPFWPPTRWNQVFRGDDCLYSGQLGQILYVDHSRRIAKIKWNGKTVRVITLDKIAVPIHRFEVK